MSDTDERGRWLHSLTQNAGRSEMNWWTTFWLSLLLGYLGADRFYLGSPMLGCLKLVTMGAGGLWWIADLVLLFANKMRDDNGGIVRRPF